MTRKKDRYTSTAPVSPAAAQSGCYGKKRYDTRNEARDRAAKVKHKGLDLRPYRCLLCNGFHLTHWAAKAAGEVRRLIRSRGGKQA